MMRRDRRLPDWEARLGRYLTEALSMPHEYGRHDCLRHCAAAVEAVTGVDLSKGRRGRYRDAKGAARHLRSLGFANAGSLVDSLLPERPVAFARRGDIVLGADGIPGVCIGAKAVYVTEQGLGTTRRGEWAKAWTVGEE